MTMHLFVMPTGTYAVKGLLMMGKERLKHVTRWLLMYMAHALHMLEN
jgi:hypothetical protein